jgi:hypothetical protein
VVVVCYFKAFVGSAKLVHAFNFWLISCCQLWQMTASKVTRIWRGGCNWVGLLFWFSRDSSRRAAAAIRGRGGRGERRPRQLRRRGEGTGGLGGNDGRWFTLCGFVWKAIKSATGPRLFFLAALFTDAES